MINRYRQNRKPKCLLNRHKNQESGRSIIQVFICKCMWKLFRKSNAFTSLPLPLPLTVLNLWITPYISTAPRFFFYSDYKSTELSFHFGCSIEHTIQFFQHHNLIWEHLQKIWNTFFPFSALDFQASPYQAFFHGFGDILLDKPSERLLEYTSGARKWGRLEMSLTEFLITCSTYGSVCSLRNRSWQ